MDLPYAITVVTTEFDITGQSDASTVSDIQGQSNFVTPTKAVSAVPSLHGLKRIRPIEALHQLSLVTSADYTDDLFDVCVQWGLLRYLGLFDGDWRSTGPPRLKLSDAGSRISGNQRRVTSEEMGIGFGAVLAQRWFEDDFGLGSVSAIVDIDNALSDGFISMGGTSVPVSLANTRRPDYIVVGAPSSIPGFCVARALECKGTRSPDYAPHQLASALGQLEGVLISGTLPRGLAVSTITADDEVSYVAIDPEGDEEVFVEVNAATLEASGEQLTSARADLPTELALRASWATLADFGRNLDALNRWAPGPMRERLRRSSRERVVRDTPFGSARGVRTTFSIRGQRLDVWHLIDVDVDDALTNGRAETILDAQVAFAVRSNQLRPEVSSTEGYSAASGGSIFAVTRD